MAGKTQKDRQEMTKIKEAKEVQQKNNDEKKTKDEIRIEDAFAYLVLRSARVLRFHFLRFASAQGYELNPEQWLLLNKLMYHEGQSQVELADDVFKDRANITRILSSMEKKGWVRRTGDPEDGRRILVYLTEEGRALHDEFSGLVIDERSRIYKGLTRKDFQELKRILDILDRNALGE